MTTLDQSSRKFLLSVENYYTWSLSMKGKLDTIEALDIILGEEIKPEGDDTDGIIRFNKLNRKAYNLILDHIDQDNLAYVAGALHADLERNGKALWNLLRNRYQADDFVNKTLAFTNFNSINYDGDIPKFASKVRMAIQKMRLVQFKSEEESNIIMTLAKLPAQFDYLKKGSDLEGKTIEQILKKLENDYNQDRIYNNLQSDGVEMITESINTALHMKNNLIVCSHCKREGHHINNCWKKHPNKIPSNIQAQIANFASVDCSVNFNECDESNFISF